MATRNSYETRTSVSNQTTSVSKMSSTDTPQKQLQKKSKFLEQIPNTEGKLINTFNIFGKPEDYIELNVYDNTNNLIAHLRDFKNYSFTEEGKTPEGLTNEVIVDPITNLRDLNFNSGQFTLEYRFQRKKMINTFKKVFFIKEISNSRREIRIDNNDLNNIQLQQRYNIFKDEFNLISTKYNSKILLQRVLSVVYNKCDSHVQDNHSSTGYCGILYLDMKPDSPKTTYIQPWNNENDKSVLYSPNVKQGDIMIVPQFLTHYTEPNKIYFKNIGSAQIKFFEEIFMESNK